jgi:Zn-finger nucleic acid-binding protein
MADIGTRWPCPVCLGATMEKVAVHGQDHLTVDHCPRCGGLWLERGEVGRLRARPEKALWAQVDRREAPRPRCHSCHAHLDPDVDECPACGHRVQLLCPPCQHPMDRARYGELTLDVCARCKGVWFDHHELAAIWKLQLGDALTVRRSAPGESVELASYVLLDALMWHPGLLYYGAAGAAQAASAAVQGIANAPEIAVGAVEAVGEAAEGVFEVVMGVVAALFEGL